MRNIARLAIDYPLYTWMLMFACLAGGVWGVDSVGRLEDPEFPQKNVLVITLYEGASAVEVEQEVTDVIEAALQELPYLKHVESKSVAGRSEITVQLMEQYDSGETPQIFDELRRRVGEAQMFLPPGTSPPLVEDDFGDVFGIMYAISAPGYTAAEIHDISRRVSTELNAVPKVAKVQTAGEPQEAIFVEIDHNRLTSLGLPIDQVFGSIAIENQVTPAGSVFFQGRRLRIAPEMAFDSVQALGDMRIGKAGSTEILKLSDVAVVSREQVEVPQQLIRHEGKKVFTIGVSISDGENVVEVGQAVDARMAEIRQGLPLGVEVEEIYAQHKVVDAAIQEFLRNLAISVATVVLALCLFMGWRAGTVVGAVLLLTVLGTICILSLIGIELQRISLGAMMIAMGMLVDNGIVVAEGMLMGVRQGHTPGQAAERAVARTQFPLLGATLIGIMAFGPISLSDDDAGHFLGSLFRVVGISLLLSWVLAVTVVPLLGNYLLRPVKDASTDLYRGWAYSPYRGLLAVSIRLKWLATLVIVLIVGALLYSFQFVKQGFFPNTNAPLYYIDYRLAEGTDIRETESDVVALEAHIRESEGVLAVTSFIGRGATRFTTILNPEQPNSSYAQLVVRVDDVTQLNVMMDATRQLLAEIRPEAEVTVSRAEFTPSGSSKIEARYYGADAEVLRNLANQTLDIYLAHQLIERKIDWRQPRLQLVPQFNVARAQVAGVTRTDLAQTLAFATLGARVGVFRDADKVIPIVARAPREERVDVDSLMDRLVWSPAQQSHIPIAQLVDEISLGAADDTIYRRNRVRVMRALANPPVGHNPTATFEQIRAEVEAIELPAGYSLEWGGEYEANADANSTLTSKIPLAFGIMFFITVLMFGRLKQAIVIWLTVPMTVCGVVLALLMTDLSFTFPSMLGLLSLAGMLIKNCVVLVDEIDKRFAEDGVTAAVMVAASVSRLRPVVLAAGTTIAGMIPLLGDAFFLEMAVCIMGGLAFGTLITLVAVPVFYSVAMGSKLSS